MTEIRGRFTNAEEGVDGGVMFYGSKGYMISDPQIDGRFQVFLNGSKTAEPAPSADNGDDRAQEAHFANFLDAVRANAPSKLTAEIKETYLSTMFCLLGNILPAGPRNPSRSGVGPVCRDAEADAMLRERIARLIQSREVVTERTKILYIPGLLLVIFSHSRC